jgi:26S proteasome regulatory subunit N11
VDPAQLRNIAAQFGGGGAQGGVAGDIPTNDNAETVHISSLALLKVRSSCLLSKSGHR